MKKISLITITLILSLVTLNSCKRKYDLPPKASEPANSGAITIDSIYKKYFSVYTCPTCAPTSYYRFPNDVSLTCTVTADEVSGNIYKTVYVQDATGTLQVKLLNAGGLAVGDLIRINLNGVIVDDYAKMVQLDSVDIEKRVVKISSGNIVTPTKSTFNEVTRLYTGAAAKTYSTYCVNQARLVVLDSVEFFVGSKNVTYADAVGKSSVDRDLTNANGDILTVRTSGYSNFAGNLIPAGKGKITVVVSQYNSTIQLIIRNISEVQLSAGNSTPPYLFKDFEDQSITSGGWINVNSVGNVPWSIGTINGTYANASNYINGSNQACETWLISPPIDLTNSTNPALAFKSATKYTGPAIQAYVVTNYISGTPTSTTLLSPNLSTGNFVWRGSNYLPLSAFKQSNVRIAFKYSGTGGNGATWEVDNIGIIEN